MFLCEIHKKDLLSTIEAKGYESSNIEDSKYSKYSDNSGHEINVTNLDSKYYRNLQEFIELNKTIEKSGLETHQQWVGDGVSREQGITNINFRVEDEEYEEFIRLYKKD